MDDTKKDENEIESEQVAQSEEDIEILDETDEDSSQDTTSKFKKLKKQLQQCRAEREEYLTALQRLKADYVNARKDEEKRREDFYKFAEEKMVHELLPILDTFDRAFVGQDEKNPFISGFKHIKSQLEKILATHGVQPIDINGKNFDPNVAETIGTIATDKAELDGVVMEIVEQGYTMHGRVIKPSKVKVGEFKK